MTEPRATAPRRFRAACGGHDARSGGSSVISQVVSDATTQDIRVVAPRGRGTSPVVVASHGIGGSGQGMGAFAARLARAGMVVFAPTCRNDLTTPDGLSQAGSDIACGTSPNDPCPGGKTSPDIVVGISGCFYDYEGKPIAWFDDVSSWANKGADIYLPAGDQDMTCPGLAVATACQCLARRGLRRQPPPAHRCRPLRTDLPRAAQRTTPGGHERRCRSTSHPGRPRRHRHPPARLPRTVNRPLLGSGNPPGWSRGLGRMAPLPHWPGGSSRDCRRVRWDCRHVRPFGPQLGRL